jgi:sialic acid synthase SpsE
VNLKRINPDIYFIAEIGQNHQGRLSIAKEMVDSLVGTGVSAIKTAKRDIDVCLTENQKKAPYPGPNSFGETYYEHRKALELSKSDLTELKEYAEEKGFDFISSFTDRPSFDFLTQIGVKYLKIASQRVTDIKLLEYVACVNATRIPPPTIFLSTGMSRLFDVGMAFSILKNCETFVLQCTSAYPCDAQDINLRVMTECNFDGISGHWRGFVPDLAAYTMGARVIERHYTLDRKMKGGDHRISLELHEVISLLRSIKTISQAMGDGVKTIVRSEWPSIIKLRADLKEETGLRHSDTRIHHG